MQQHTLCGSILLDPKPSTYMAKGRIIKKITYTVKIIPQNIYISQKSTREMILLNTPECIPKWQKSSKYNPDDDPTQVIP